MLLVQSPTRVLQSPWARHLTLSAADKLAVALHVWHSRQCVNVCRMGDREAIILKRLGSPLDRKAIDKCITFTINHYVKIFFRDYVCVPYECLIDCALCISWTPIFISSDFCVSRNTSKHFGTESQTMWINNLLFQWLARGHVMSGTSPKCQTGKRKRITL
jgi:hypothetical protein